MDSDVANLTAPQPKRPKSPPLAFEKTPNDALTSLISPPTATPDHSSSRLLTPNSHSNDMAHFNSLSPTHSADLQVVVDQQALAIQLLHDAFAVERQSWAAERERLYQRIAALERLLKNGDHHSPAKSPVLSPAGNTHLTSPQARALSNSNAQRLPSIAEDTTLEPLSKRRDTAQLSIDTAPPSGEERVRRGSTVGFKENAPNTVQVEEIPISPVDPTRAPSPPPLNFRMEAGHTPPSMPRPPTPPPHNSLSIDGIDDTPTRNNTHINAFLTRSNDEEEDRALKGPLNMPELPNRPSDSNFTLDMLSRKLEQIHSHPDENTSRPMVFAEPSPGLASPIDATAQTIEHTGDTPPAPFSSRNPEMSVSHSDMSSNALSPHTFSPNHSNNLNNDGNHIGESLSPQHSREAQVHHHFEQGGIRLKKKPSVNFGAPFGQLNGFSAAARRTSQD